MNATERDRIMSQESYDKALNKAEANLKTLQDYIEKLRKHRDTYQHTPSACFYYAAVALQSQRQIEVALDAMDLGHHQSGVVGKRMNELQEKLSKAQAELPLVHGDKDAVPAVQVGQFWLRAWSNTTAHLALSNRIEQIVDIEGEGPEAKIKTTISSSRLPMARSFVHGRIYIGTIVPNDSEIIKIVKAACDETKAGARGPKNVRRWLKPEELTQ